MAERATIDKINWSNIPDNEFESRLINSGVAAAQLFTTFDVDGGDEEQQWAAADRTEQKKAFLADQIANPTLNNCPRFKSEHGSRNKAYERMVVLSSGHTIRQLNGDRMTATDEVIAELIAMRRHEYRAVDNAARIAGGMSFSGRYQTARSLKADVRAAYGMPDRDDASALLARRVAGAENIMHDKEHGARTFAGDVIDMVAIRSADAQPPRLMSDEAVSHYQRIIIDDNKEAINYAFNLAGDRDVYSVDETADIFKRFMDARGYSEQGFGVEVIPNRSTSLANMPAQAVLIGADRSEGQRSRNKITDSLLHEVGVHIRRMAQARKLGMQLGSYTLAGAHIFEEPLAATLVDSYNGVAKLHGEPYTTAIALSAGYDGNGERDFRQSHDVLWRLSLLKSYSPDKALETQITSARSIAYNSLVRVWRGMPTDMPGCIMPRDHAYANESVHAYLQPDGKMLAKDEFLHLFDARYDPRNKPQTAYVNQFTR